MTDPTKKKKKCKRKARDSCTSTHAQKKKTESSTKTSRLMRYHMTELPTKQHRELGTSNRKKQTNNSKSPLLQTTDRKKETHATQKQKGKDAPQERGPHKRGFQEKEEERRTKGARDLNILI
jgi:hypothetical protein